MEELRLSKLGHTWIFDLDGTLVKHNGHLSGVDELLPGVVELFDSIPSQDYILLITSRAETYKTETLRLLEDTGIRFDSIIFDAPVGERILVNDTKPRGLKTAIAVNVARDEGLSINITETEE